MINSVRSSVIDIEYTTIQSIADEIQKEENQLIIDREKFEQEKKQMRSSTDKIDVLQLNVGGEIITTTRQTLTKIPKSMLYLMFNGQWGHKLQRDQDGNIFLDFNRIIFRHLLDQLQAIDINTSIQLYPPFQPSLIKAFNKMIKKLGLQQMLLSDKKNIITFNVGGKLITNRRTTFTKISNSTFDTSIVSSRQHTNFNNESDVFVDYDPKVFQHLTNQLRKKSFKTISYLELSSYDERIAFETMLIDLSIYRK
jgi:hypothetical protein